MCFIQKMLKKNPLTISNGNHSLRENAKNCQYENNVDLK